MPLPPRKTYKTVRIKSKTGQRGSERKTTNETESAHSTFSLKQTVAGNTKRPPVATRSQTSWHAFEHASYVTRNNENT